MPGSQSLSKPQTFNYDLADASLTGFASNVTGATWTLTAHAATDGLAHQVSVRNDSANNKSSIAIVLVGLDADGNAQTESITGPTGSATVESTLYYKYLTSVTPASTWGADTADIGWVDEIASPIIGLNWLADAIAALNADVTGTINYTLQQTFDDFTLPAFTAPSQQVQWIDVASAKTADGIFNTVGGALGARLLVNSYSSGAEIQLNVNPTYVANQPDGGTGVGSDVNIISPLDAHDHVQTVLYDASGNAQTYNANGQATMANSTPVVIASDQSALPGNITQTGGNALVAVGTSAGTTVPLPVGGLAQGSGTFPNYTNGQRAQEIFEARGGLFVTLKPENSASAVSTGSPNSDNQTPGNGTVLNEATYAYGWNGTGWDRIRLAGSLLGQLVELGPYSYSRKTADGQVKATAGFIHTVSITPTGTVTAGVLSIYNSASESGAVVASFSLPVTTFTPFSVQLDVACGTGIYVGFDATLANVGVTISYR